jgi:Tfp pilus assembly protein PilF
MDRAIPLAEDGAWDEAVPILEAVLEQDPRNAEAIRLLAKERFGRGATEEAFQLWESALEYAPRSARLWLDYGTALLQRRRPEEAVAVLERAVELRGSDVDARVRLATAALRSGDLQSAARQTQIARALDPEDARARRLARQLEERGVLPAGTP